MAVEVGRVAAQRVGAGVVGLGMWIDGWMGGVWFRMGYRAVDGFGRVVRLLRLCARWVVVVLFDGGCAAVVGGAGEAVGGWSWQQAEGLTRRSAGLGGAGWAS